MAALVQSYPQQSGTATMLQTRPSSASGILQSSSQAPSHHQYSQNISQVHRNSFHGMSNTMAANYRGHATMEPIAPYAFTRTPALVSTPRTASGPHLRADQRSSSALGVPTYDSGAAANRSRYPASPSISTTSSSSSSELSAIGQKAGSKDDTSPGSRTASGTPQLTMTTSAPGVTLNPPATSTTAKASPDRYRRSNNRRAESVSAIQTSAIGTSMPNVKQFYGSSAQQATVALTAKQASGGQAPQVPQVLVGGTAQGVTADDMQLNLGKDQGTRYRRRSIHTIEADRFSYDGVNPLGGLQQQGSRQVSSANGRIDQQQQQHPLRSSPVITLRPGSSHARNNSNDSVNSSRSSHRSRPSSAKRDANPSSMATVNPAPTSSLLSANTSVNQASSRNDLPKLVNIPLRGSSSEAAKRVANPSPLSKPMAMSPETLTSKDSFASAVTAALHAPSKPTYAQVANGTKTPSPAAKQLAALSDKDGKKNKTSRLRRAFSFGSAAELRKASAENTTANNAAAVDNPNSREDAEEKAREAEQARIAAQQEAAGLGSGIYSGQGNFFTGSTDNISISSTASSASIMIRKMGKGMKKSTRSLVGLFRPKSIIGAPTADIVQPEVSQAQVSMVNVEAEREKVNVNVDPHDHAGGGTGFPKLERNSVDAVAAGSVVSERTGSSGTEDSGARRSIVGGEKERAEVLAAVKKGILKRSGTDSGNASPVMRPVGDTKSPSFQLPQIPNINDSPASSAPSTPNDELQGHRRTGSVTLGGEDYFMSALRFQGASKSVPSTPPGAKRNATFSPRIQFHDTWPSGEYDRRGEIATCNRLTPMLAQQIKEELNTFKMEMEVHENSKIYTHFF